MTDLKPGWKRVKFGEVVRLNKETCKDPEAAGINRVIGLEHLEPGDLRVRSWAEVADGTTFSNRVRPGQVLFGKRRSYQRKVAVAGFDAICSGDIYVFESADQTQLLQELLPFICQTDSFFEYAIGTSAGSLSPRTNWKSLAEYEFVLPPFEQQSSMLKPLFAGYAAAEQANRVAATAASLEQSLLATAFPIARMDVRPTSPLGDVAEIQLGYKVSPVHRGERVSKRIITVAQLQDGRIDVNAAKEITIPVHMVERFRPRIGTLLMTEGGNIDQLGRGAIWAGEIEDCVYQNHVFSVTARPNIVCAEYLEGLMRSPRGREFFLGNAKRTSNLASIDQRKVRTLPVPVVPLGLQHKWSERYSEAKSCRLRSAKRALEAFDLLRIVASTVLKGAA